MHITHLNHNHLQINFMQPPTKLLLLNCIGHIYVVWVGYIIDIIFMLHKKLFDTLMAFDLKILICNIRYKYVFITFLYLCMYVYVYKTICFSMCMPQHKCRGLQNDTQHIMFSYKNIYPLSHCKNVSNFINVNFNIKNLECKILKIEG